MLLQLLFESTYFMIQHFLDRDLKYVQMQLAFVGLVLASDGFHLTLLMISKHQAAHHDVQLLVWTPLQSQKLQIYGKWSAEYSYLRHLLPQKSLSIFFSVLTFKLYMQSKNGSYEQIDIIISQMLKRQRVKERYDTERKIRFQGCVSKDLISSSSKNRQTRIFSNNKTANDIESVILSQPQLNQNKRVIKTGSKTKYDSMQKLRKEFLKNGYTSYEYSRTESQRKIIDVPETRVVDDKIGIQQLHYQLVKLHQNVRKMHHER